MLVERPTAIAQPLQERMTRNNQPMFGPAAPEQPLGGV